MCGFCNPERYLDGDKIVAWGYRESIYVGVDDDNRLILYASGESSSCPFRPLYCPMCGAKLLGIGKEGFSK